MRSAAMPPLDDPTIAAEADFEALIAEDQWRITEESMNDPIQHWTVQYESHLAGLSDEVELHLEAAERGECLALLEEREESRNQAWELEAEDQRLIASAERAHDEVAWACARMDSEAKYWAGRALAFEYESLVDRSKLPPLSERGLEALHEKEHRDLSRAYASQRDFLTNRYLKATASAESALQSCLHGIRLSRVSQFMRAECYEDYQSQLGLLKSSEDDARTALLETHSDRYQRRGAAAAAAAAVFGSVDSLRLILDALQDSGAELTTLPSFARYSAVSRSWWHACRAIFRRAIDSRSAPQRPGLDGAPCGDCAPLAFEQSIEARADAMCLLPTGQLCVALYAERQCRLYQPGSLDAALYDLIEPPLVEPAAAALDQPLLGLATSPTHLHLVLAHPARAIEGDAWRAGRLSRDVFSLYSRPHLYAWHDQAEADVRQYERDDLPSQSTSGGGDWFHLRADGNETGADFLNHASSSSINREQRVAAHGELIFLAFAASVVAVHARTGHTHEALSHRKMRGARNPSLGVSDGKLHVTCKSEEGHLVALTFAIDESGALQPLADIDLTSASVCQRAGGRLHLALAHNVCVSSTDAQRLYVTGATVWDARRHLMDGRRVSRRTTTHDESVLRTVWRQILLKLGFGPSHVEWALAQSWGNSADGARCDPHPSAYDHKAIDDVVDEWLSDELPRVMSALSLLMEPRAAGALRVTFESVLRQTCRSSHEPTASRAEAHFKNWRDALTTTYQCFMRLVQSSKFKDSEVDCGWAAARQAGRLAQSEREMRAGQCRGRHRDECDKYDLPGVNCLHVLRCTPTCALSVSRVMIGGFGHSLAGLGAICSGGGRVYVSAPDKAPAKHRLEGTVGCSLRVARCEMAGTTRVCLKLHCGRWSVDSTSPAVSRIYVLREQPPPDVLPTRSSATTGTTGHSSGSGDSGAANGGGGGGGGSGGSLVPESSATESAGIASAVAVAPLAAWEMAWPAYPGLMPPAHLGQLRAASVPQALSAHHLQALSAHHDDDEHSDAGSLTSDMYDLALP